MATLTENQLHRLQRATNDLGRLLAEVDPSPAKSERRAASTSAQTFPEPRWRGEYRRQWRFLKDIEDHGGRLPYPEVRSLGLKHGYKPRGLGGFYNGDNKALRQSGSMRELTAAGKRFLRDWEHEFGGEADD